MPKWKPLYDTRRKYNQQWEKNFFWVNKAPGLSEEAFCKLCFCNIEPKLDSLHNHEKTGKHK